MKKTNSEKILEVLTCEMGRGEIAFNAKVEPYKLSNSLDYLCKSGQILKRKVGAKCFYRKPGMEESSQQNPISYSSLAEKWSCSECGRSEPEVKKIQRSQKCHKCKYQYEVGRKGEVEKNWDTKLASSYMKKRIGSNNDITGRGVRQV